MYRRGKGRNDTMINFTVGPVQSNEMVSAIGAEQVPYFRTPEFSKLMMENESLVLKFAKAPAGARAVFITGSGTASMEATIMNTLTSDDKALVINGGSFGARFAQMLSLHEIPYTEIKLDVGEPLTEELLAPYNSQGYSAFLVNVHETSTGVHYDIDMISRFCKRNGLFLIVDAISSFLADEFDMGKLEAGVMITGSQKALACPPGISIICLSPEGIERVERSKTKCMYLDLKAALKNQERGQTPFTCAVGILRQINCRLREIDANGGVESEIKRTAGLAEYFRKQIRDFPFRFVTNSPSNAVTALHPTTAKAYDIFTTLKDEYGIWVCPNGGAQADMIFRVGHIGDLKTEDYDRLIAAFVDMRLRKLL